jgi:hypothetical protein
MDYQAQVVPVAPVAEGGRALTLLMPLMGPTLTP